MSEQTERESQRVRDTQPCPHCGGDRLRPNFTGDNGVCHVGGGQAARRWDAYADAIRRTASVDSGELLRDVVDAVVSLADQEQAELRAEVERREAAVLRAEDERNAALSALADTETADAS